MYRISKLWKDINAIRLPAIFASKNFDVLWMGSNSCQEHHTSYWITDWGIELKLQHWCFKSERTDLYYGEAFCHYKDMHICHHSGTHCFGCLCRAGAAGTAGTVLAVPLFGRLTISRRGLAIQSGGSGTHVVALNWCERSIYMHAVRNGQLLTFRFPGTSSDSSPVVCRIRFP